MFRDERTARRTWREETTENPKRINEFLRVILTNRKMKIYMWIKRLATSEHFYDELRNKYVLFMKYAR